MGRLQTLEGPGPGSRGHFQQVLMPGGAGSREENGRAWASGCGADGTSGARLAPPGAVSPITSGPPGAPWPARWSLRWGSTQTRGSPWSAPRSTVRRRGRVAAGGTVWTSSLRVAVGGCPQARGRRLRGEHGTGGGAEPGDPGLGDHAPRPPGAGRLADHPGGAPRRAGEPRGLLDADREPGGGEVRPPPGHCPTRQGGARTHDRCPRLRVVGRGAAPWAPHRQRRSRSTAPGVARIAQRPDAPGPRTHGGQPSPADPGRRQHHASRGRTRHLGHIGTGHPGGAGGRGDRPSATGPARSRAMAGDASAVSPSPRRARRPAPALLGGPTIGPQRLPGRAQCPSEG